MRAEDFLGKGESKMDNSESRLGLERKGTSTSHQTLLYEEEGANPDSVREVWVDSESDEPVIDYGIKYPPK